MNMNIGIKYSVRVTGGAYMPVAALGGAMINCDIKSVRNNTKNNKSSDTFFRHFDYHNQLKKKKTFVCKVSEQSQTPIVYEGAYGPWTIDSSDIQEVILYRSGLVTAALSFVLASSTAFMPQSGNEISLFRETINQSLDILYLLGSAGLGLSLYLIHIYVTEIKRFLQALWVLGVIGSVVTYVGLAQPNDQGLMQYVVHNPLSVWLVGPLFASLTGLVFKEGLCYGKLEAAVLAILIPVTLVGHLSGTIEDGVKLCLLGLWMVLFIVFAGRKFTQPIKDDIGDKSVFIFNALPEGEKAAFLEKLDQRRP